jgi:hypothetical protein
MSPSLGCVRLSQSCPRPKGPGKVVCMPLERGACPWFRAAGGSFGTVAVVCTPGGEDMRAPVVRGAMAGHDRGEMEIERARLIAERLHADDCEEDGTALLHIRRVARRLQADVQVVAWLHEVPRDFTERAQLSRAGQVGELIVVAEEAVEDDDLADYQVVDGQPHAPSLEFRPNMGVLDSVGS